MTAKGKINASNVQINDRIIVQENDGVTRTDTIRPSDTKTGEGVRVARVIGKTFRAAGRYEARGKYIIETTAGWFEAAPIQTMWLAPEDAAGIKRAHTEALAEDRERELVAHEALAAELAAQEAEEFTTADHEEALAAQEAALSGQRPVEFAGSHAFRPGTADPRHCDFGDCGARAESPNHNGWAPREVEFPIPPEFFTTETTPAVPTTEDHTGSTVVRLLEKVWARIRADHPELPEVVIITGSGLMGQSRWGHFRAEGWKLREEGAAVRKHELFLAGEALAKGSRQVLQTMLHEAAHTLAKVRGQQDTSRQGRWHNATFRKTAEEMGLEHRSSQADKSHGFSFVTLTAATAERYADLLAELDVEIKLVCHLPLWMGGTADQDEETEGGEKITGKPQGEGGAKSGPLKATCGCEEPLIIRLSQKVMDLGVVRCDKCEELFTAG